VACPVRAGGRFLEEPDGGSVAVNQSR
jgi:hypothetical protein